MRRGLLVPVFGSVLGMIVLGGLASVNRLAGQEKKDAMPEPTVKVGDMAPDFTLRDTHGKEVSLHDFRGKKNVALAFYIFAFTGG
jgi:cytochrome oxidase Cu insertion factor (SCO1/SenC/PrrC family)